MVVAGCRHGGLAVARALGPLGFRIVAVGTDAREFGARSRYVAEHVVCPDPADGDAFAGFLLDRASIWGRALLLETEDAFTEAIARSRAQLEASYHVVTPPWDVARWFLRKDRTAALARTVGVAHPRTVAPAELDATRPPLTLPAMVKPVRSSEFVAAFGVKLWVFEDWDDLRRGVRRAQAAGIEIVVQEVIPGPDAGALESVEVYVNRDGSLGAHQCNVKLRQSPPMYGVMRAGRSVPTIPDVLEPTVELLRRVGFTGFASAEFKRDPRDGAAKLIEINVRMPRNLALMTRSGTNFPHEIHGDVVDGRPSRVRPLRPAWFVDAGADLTELVRGDLGVLRHPRSLLGPYVGRRRAAAVFSRRDPAPALRWMQNKAAKLGGHRPARPIVK